MKFGIDRLIAEPALRAPLRGRRVALLAHPASVTENLTHSLDALAACGDVRLTAAFGPQHGLRGDKQDNMMESPHFNDPMHGIPVFSLYGEVRRPTDAMLDTCDVILVDLQDLGCRIYTFNTTLRYVLEAAAQHGKAIWVLDRPNPVGRPVEGLTLREGWQSFVGAGPLPMRHGLTLGELGTWFVRTFGLDVDYRVIALQDWQPNVAPGFGWPLGELAWVNPSPNAPNLWMARAYAGTVMVEGTTLSEGRGTTRPLELFGAPDIDARKVIAEMHALAPHWLHGCRLRDCWFEPTFHKHAGKLCNGVQIHSEGRNRFSPLPPLEKWIHHIPHDRARPNDRNLYDDVVKALRLQARQTSHLRPALDLKHSHCVGLLQRGIDERIVRRKMRQIHLFFIVIANQFERILQRRHHAETQQIDFDDAHVGAVFLIPLHHHAVRHGCGLQRDDGVETPFTDDHATRVLPQMPRQILRGETQFEILANPRMLEIKSGIAQTAVKRIIFIFEFPG